MTCNDIPVNLPDCGRSHTTSQCWGDSHVKAAGAGDREETLPTIPCTCMLFNALKRP